MTNKFVIRAAAYVALVSAGSALAHHSISMFAVETPIWVKGTVLSYSPINPHAVIVLEEITNDGMVRRWMVEGPSLGRLRRMDIAPDFIQTGDVIEVCGFPPKAQFSSERSSLDTAGYPPQTFHGHMLLTPEWGMQPWGPYGKLENCIRPDDQVQNWVDFLNTNQMAQSLWCHSQGYMRDASLPAKEFVDQVSSQMNQPCD